MKNTFFILLLTFLHSSGFSQNHPGETLITMDKENISLGEILEKLENEYNLQFSYDENNVSLQKSFSISVENVDLQTFFSKLFNNTDLKIRVLSNHVVIFKSKSAEKKIPAYKTISGYVIDKNTGERLLGAALYTNDFSVGTVSNNFGFFSMRIDADCSKISCSYLGYTRIEIDAHSISDLPMTIELEPSVALEEVVVRSGTPGLISKSATVGEMNVSVDQIEKLPYIFGEKDVLKTAQLLPGVSEGSEGNAGLYIRGGNIDQNLVLLDDVPVFNPNHLFGFISVFNPDALKSFKVIKGGFPARYGGRLSSVVDLRTKEGNREKFSGAIGVGLLSSRISLEGPLRISNQPAKSTFFVSGRISNMGLIVQPFIQEYSDYDKSDYSFYDINAKLTYTPHPSHRFYVSYYSGLDKGSTELNDDNSSETVINETSYYSSMHWGNEVASFRWNWLLSRKLFSNLTISFSRYDYRNENSKNGILSTMNDSIKKTTVNYSLQSSGIENINLAEDLSFYANNIFDFRFGVGIKFIRFNTSNNAVLFTIDDQENLSGTLEYYSSSEQTAYVENIISFPRNVKSNLGIRYSGYTIDNTYYNAFEPRISTQWDISDKVALKGGYGRMNQYVHLLSFSRISLSNDIWVPVTKNVPPASSDQFSLALFLGVKDYLTVSVEGFYKDLNNLIEYKEGAALSDNNLSWQEKVESGKGTSKGIEILIDKHRGKLNGWISYTLARSDRTFPGINDGYTFPFKYSRTHDFKATINYQLFKNWNIGGTAIFRSGHYETVPVQRMATTIRGVQDTPSGNYLLYMFNRNNYQFPIYKRVDLSINWSKQYRLLKHSVSVGAYNIFNFDNAYNYYIDETITYNRKGGEFQSIKMNIDKRSLFTILPSFSYSIHF